MTSIRNFTQDICVSLINKKLIDAIDLSSFNSNLDYINNYFNILFNNQYMFDDFSNNLDEAVYDKQKQMYYYGEAKDDDKYNFYLNIINEKIKKLK